MSRSRGDPYERSVATAGHIAENSIKLDGIPRGCGHWELLGQVGSDDQLGGGRVARLVDQHQRALRVRVVGHNYPRF